MVRIHDRPLPEGLATEARTSSSPLYHAVRLIRSLTLGHVGTYNLVDLAYLVVLGVLGMLLARRRMAGLLLT